MPIYEYRCKSCGEQFEYIQRMSDDPMTTCEACGQQELERLISAAAFHLKGGGWYKDLYSSTKKDSGSDGSSDASADSSSSSDSSPSSSDSSSSSDSASSDSKPAKSVETKPKSTSKKESS